MQVITDQVHNAGLNLASVTVKINCRDASMPYNPQVPLDLPHAHVACVHRDDLLIEPKEAALALCISCGSKLPRRNPQLQRLALRQHRLLAVAAAVNGGLLAL